MPISGLLQLPLAASYYFLLTGYSRNMKEYHEVAERVQKREQNISTKKYNKSKIKHCGDHNLSVPQYVKRLNKTNVTTFMSTAGPRFSEP